MKRPVGGYRLIGMGIIWTDQKTLFRPDQKTLAVQDQFSLSFDTIKPLKIRHAVGTFDRRL